LEKKIKIIFEKFEIKIFLKKLKKCFLLKNDLFITKNAIKVKKYFFLSQIITKKFLNPNESHIFPLLFVAFKNYIFCFWQKHIQMSNLKTLF
jgi:hypothetical protein